MAAAAAAAAPVTAPLAEKVAAKVEPRRGRKKRVLLLLGLVGLGGFVAKKLRGSGAASHTPAYTPPARPVPTPRPAPVADPLTTASTPPAPSAGGLETDPDAPEATVDRGGAFLDEAVSDASDEPHEATTPDAPLSTEDVSDVEDPSRA
jgi:hypothetical protein